MSALEHIVVASDFGSSSVRAVHLAAELATRFEARLTVLHVVRDPLPLYALDAPFTSAPGATEDRELAAKHDLDSFLTSLPSRIPHSEGILRFGDPVREIVAYADEAACNLIVMGTHGRRRLSRFLLGS